MTVQKLGWIVLIPLVIAAIALYLSLPRGAAVVCLAATLFLIVRLMFARRL